ncbi:unnamed protein product, partial [Amoebophrya sp. A120]
PDGELFTGSATECERLGGLLYRKYASSSFVMQIAMGASECGQPGRPEKKDRHGVIKQVYYEPTAPPGCSFRIDHGKDGEDNWRTFYNRAYMAPQNLDNYGPGECVLNQFIGICTFPANPGVLKYWLVNEDNMNCEKAGDFAGFKVIQTAGHCGYAAG